jgi:hypothetical protein
MAPTSRISGIHLETILEEMLDQNLDTEAKQENVHTPGASSISTASMQTLVTVKSEFQCSAVLCNIPRDLTREDLVFKLKEFGFHDGQDIELAQTRFLTCRHAETFDVLVWFRKVSSMRAFAAALHKRSLRSCGKGGHVLVKGCTIASPGSSAPPRAKWVK